MMTRPILQTHLPDAPWTHPATARLPGVQPLRVENWLIRDEAFAGQMAERDRLIATRADDVHALLPEARRAAEETLTLALRALADDPGYRIGVNTVMRPDGVNVALDWDDPLLTLGRLMQADVCVMQAGRAGHVLTGAILCFPASWTLSEKVGHPMVRIHGPVTEYDGAMAARVQRLFDAIRKDQPLWRSNAVLYEAPDLFQPAREAAPRPAPVDPTYMRSERQTLRRLPETDAVVFTIHTRVVRVADLSDAQTEGLAQSAGI